MIVAAGLAAASGSALVFMIVNLTGWIPMLICAFGESYAIGFEYGFIGGWAQLALLMYWIEAIGLLYVLFTKPDPEGLPDGWKFIGLLYTYAPSRSVRESFKEEGPSWSARSFASYMKSGAPEWGFNKVLNARQMAQSARAARAEAERLRRENEQRAEELRAAKEMADAMRDLEREKAKAKAYGEET